ncbi:RIP metalloprotease RseP [Limoniibacter endophyticus]|uniref:RIP metalloprotease RseP n=1 Tax=Limoniibacter endophyticus TaxID=1565040 RepID=UPI00360A3384
MQELSTFVWGMGDLVIGMLLPFFFVLLLVVFIHELGHYLVGRWCGIGVEAFSLGFGPELIGFNDRHGTRWKLSAIPLGGYVKFLGDMGVASQSDPEALAAMSDHERKHAFQVQPIWKRFLTVLAGPVFNFILTVAIFTILFSIYGRTVSDPVVAEVRPDSPAAAAGFHPGDRIVRIGDVEIKTFADLQMHVFDKAGEELPFLVQRGNQELTLRATPEMTEHTDPLGNKVRTAIIGIVTNIQVGNPQKITYGPIAAVGESVKATGEILYRTGEFISQFVVGRGDRCQLSGPVRIAGMAEKAAALGIPTLLQLAAVLSAGIGFLNLLPVPPLDGGHLTFYTIEAITRRPVSERVMEIFYRLGFILVLGLMVLVFWNDLFGC